MGLPTPPGVATKYSRFHAILGQETPRVSEKPDKGALSRFNWSSALERRSYDNCRI